MKSSKRLVLIIAAASVLSACTRRAPDSSEMKDSSKITALPVDSLSVAQPPQTAPVIDTAAAALPAENVAADLQVKVFKNDAPLDGYGYDILKAGKLYIHQPQIPAVPGNHGFSTEDKARKTATLVITKIKKNILPPSVDVKELDSLGVMK